MGKLSNTEEFLEKLRAKYGDKYDYSKVKYVNQSTPITLICSEKGEITKTPKHLLRYIATPPRLQTETNQSSTDEFIERVIIRHGDRYDYSKLEYKFATSNIKIICKIHGEFEQMAIEHLVGRGCPKCGGSFRDTAETFVAKAKKVHGDRYNYSKVNYINANTHVIIKCNSCDNEFQQKPKKHSFGAGCPTCRFSKGEPRIKEILNDLGIEHESQKTFDNCKNILKLPFDFYIPKYNLCIEFDGKQHFRADSLFYINGKNSFEQQQMLDEMKTTFCKTNNVHLLRIPYTKYNKIGELIKEKISELIK